VELTVAPTVALTTQQALWLKPMQFYICKAWLLDERNRLFGRRDRLQAMCNNGLRMASSSE